MENQDSYLNKIGREANIVFGGTFEGAVDEAWRRAQDPAALCATIAKDTLLAASVAAVGTIVPEIVLPALAVSTALICVENRAEEKRLWKRNERLYDACQSAWNDPNKESTAKKLFASELGKQAFDITLAGLTMSPGFALGQKFAEAKLAQIAEKSMASKSLVMSDLGQGTMQTRMGDSLVTTHADGTVIKQFDSGLIQRHIPTESGDYIFTEARQSGVYTMDLPGGTRMIELPTGRFYSFYRDGSYAVEKPSGLRLAQSGDEQIRTFTHPNGTVTKFTGTQKERTFPQL